MRSLYLHWLPNFITIGRLVLTPAAIDMIVTENWPAAFAVFAAAGASDALDGWLAKTFDLRTELGALLDPAADKALIVSIYATLAIGGVIPAWLALLVVSRDVMIIGAVALSWLLQRRIDLSPLPVSKATTAAQLTFAAVVLAGKAFAAPLDGIIALLAGIVAALTALSAAVYLWRWVKNMGP
ncbi:MAG TPA: CDP-alcohol phosphatidyltransferase family protein [Methylosinus sp.]|jgi:cardiolipin synthase